MGAGALNCEKGQNIHNHSPPSEWKILPRVLQDVTQAVSHNIHVTPKGIQNGQGMDYQPMEASIAAANIGRVRSVVRKAKSALDKTDNENKDRIGGNSTNQCNTENINKLVGTYQLYTDDAFCFGLHNQYAIFQSPFQANSGSQPKYCLLIWLSSLPYLLNIVCENKFTLKYMPVVKPYRISKIGNQLERHYLF